MDTTTAPLISIDIDIGKDVFHLVGFDTDGTIAFRRKIKRLALFETFKVLPPCIVGMEACLRAHSVSRALRQLGHEPRIIPAIYVKPFVKRQKNYYNDAEAIAEAALRPNLRTVREKSQDQLDLDHADHLSTRQYARLVDEWVTAIGLQREDYGTHSLRRTKAAMIYKATANLGAIQIPLGHAKIENSGQVPWRRH